MPKWDRFDICEAWYVYALEHGRWGSHLHGILIRLNRMGFLPRPSLSRDTLKENGWEILGRLEEGAFGQHATRHHVHDIMRSIRK